MADVLIVCVREDEPQAKALAEMFEAAGFSIGGAPSNDGALRSSGAGVVVWSQASIRSRPFLDAAQRVINANKAIVASLIDPPPPSSIGNSPAFDLSRWNGDPNDPSLDPLFFAVDRMVNSARVGAAPARDEAYDAPPPVRTPSRAAPLQAPPPPAYRAPPAAAPADPLGAEAEHWRTIRESRNPADFMDYLSRYGAQGAFAEVAELRLKQLTSGDQRPAPAPRPEPRPEPRTEARAQAPRREAAPPPQRRPDPPPRRPDPPPRRAEAPPRMPPPERLDRDLRDPPRNEGGALRAFVLIALLGGAALAGGLYFGGGLGPGPEQSSEIVEPPTPLGAPSDTPLPEDALGGAEVSPEPAGADRQTQIAAREEQRAAAAQQQRERDRERQRELERERAAATPAPTTTTAANTTPPRSGPVSLTGPTSGGDTLSSPGQSAVPLAPPTTAPATTRPAATTPRETEPLRGTAGTVTWAQRPSARRIADLYPQRALREGVGGRVTMDCVVQPSLNVVCSIASESPAGEGFGRAALSASSSYRASPTLSDGSSAVGARSRISVSFQAPQ